MEEDISKVSNFSLHFINNKAAFLVNSKADTDEIENGMNEVKTRLEAYRILDEVFNEYFGDVETEGYSDFINSQAGVIEFRVGSFPSEYFRRDIDGDWQSGEGRRQYDLKSDYIYWIDEIWNDTQAINAIYSSSNLGMVSSRTGMVSWRITSEYAQSSVKVDLYNSLEIFSSRGGFSVMEEEGDKNILAGWMAKLRRISIIPISKKRENIKSKLPSESVDVLGKKYSFGLGMDDNARVVLFLESGMSKYGVRHELDVDSEDSEIKINKVYFEKGKNGGLDVVSKDSVAYMSEEELEDEIKRHEIKEFLISKC